MEVINRRSRGHELADCLLTLSKWRKKNSFFGYLQGNVEINLGMGILCEYMGKWRWHGAELLLFSNFHDLWEITGKVFSSSINYINYIIIKKVARRSVSYVYCTPLWGGVPGMSYQEESTGQTQGTLEGLRLSDGLGAPWDPSRRAGVSIRGEGSQGLSA